MAATYLADLDVQEASAEIGVLLDAHSEWARGAAIDALGRLRAGSFAPRIVELATTDPFGPNRLRAIAALGRLGYPDALNDILPFLESDTFEVRRAAAYALGELGDPRAEPSLRAAKRRERLWRRGRFRGALSKIQAAVSR